MTECTYTLDGRYHTCKQNFWWKLHGRQSLEGQRWKDNITVDFREMT
jgi:hypothetical protein